MNLPAVTTNKTIAVLALAASFAAGSCTHKHTITVENPADVAASGELAQVALKDVQAKVGEHFVITDADGVEVPYQVTYDSLVVFPVNADAASEVVYTLSAGESAPVDTLVWGRKFPERKDDMAWENDRSAYRAYGPALQASGERAFGYDIWTKSVATPVLEERFTNDIQHGISFHVDHGNGMDVYAVGPTLGGGTAALLDSLGNIVYPYCWDTYEILDNGPLRFTVRLDYKPLAIDGDTAVVESRLITLDRGAWLNRTEVTYRGLTHEASVAPGIVVHRQNPDGYTLNREAGYMAYADSTENAANGNGVIYVGVVAPQSTAFEYRALAEPAGDAIGHILAPAPYTDGTPYTYYWGSGWSKGGVAGVEEWNAILDTAARRVASPLKARVD